MVYSRLSTGESGENAGNFGNDNEDEEDSDEQSLMHIDQALTQTNGDLEDEASLFEYASSQHSTDDMPIIIQVKNTVCTILIA